MNVIFSVLLIIFVTISKSDDSECPRIRRAWNTLTTEERQLYITGLVALRDTVNGDEFVAIGSVHQSEFAPVTHRASSYLFWHGYLVYELETRIRALGGKWECFGMPYYDFTVEINRTSDPFIFHTGLGGDGDPNNYWTVNEYSWEYTKEQFGLPLNCVAEGDEYPHCSLKRSLGAEWLDLPTIQEVGAAVYGQSEFRDWTNWNTMKDGKPYNAIHGLLHNPTMLHQIHTTNTETAGYDPIWYLFHSMVEYYRAMWTDCNQYDLINVQDLDNHPEAYTPFCFHTECVKPTNYPSEWMGMELDDTMHFEGDLKDKEWAYIYSNDLTVRKFYDMAAWNIMYDLSNDDGLFDKSGLKEHCSSKLNNSWFMGMDDEQKKRKKKKHNEQTQAAGTRLDLYAVNILVIVVFILFLVFSRCKCLFCNDSDKDSKLIVDKEYGTF